jgi:GNAT superfamily N-acetyltransferase
MIRRALAADAPQLLSLMRGLARFEGYDDRFAVTVDDLIQRGLSPLQAPQFTAWVAELDGTLVGYAVVYVIPFTFDLRPSVVLKELFIGEAARGGKFGHGLMDAVIDYTRSINGRMIRWQVLPSNDPAKRFYSQFGARVDNDWENWFIDLDRR